MYSDMTVLQAKMLALVGWVDGRFDENERTVLHDVLKVSPADDSLKEDLFRLADTPPDKDSVLATVATAPREIVAAAIKNAYVLAEADGYLDNAEMDLLFEFAVAAGVAPDRVDDFQRMLNIHLSALELERDLFGT